MEPNRDASPGRCRGDGQVPAGVWLWQSVFTIPDGAIAFGSAVDGTPFAVFPEKGDWIGNATWANAALATVLDGAVLPRALDERRAFVAARLEEVAGPVLHNPTRGRFVAPGVERYGRFLGEWGAIYQRFGVPAEIGLAQALIESGFEGARRSEAGAIGLCQWDSASFEPMLQSFVRRFRATNTEEGSVMATVLTYVLSESSTSGRRDILSAFRTSEEIRSLFERGVRERAATLAVNQPG